MRALAALSLFVCCMLFVGGCDNGPPARDAFTPPVDMSRQTPPPGGGKTAADPWYVGLKKVELAKTVDLTGLTFVDNLDQTQDLRVDGYLLAYGAQQRKGLNELAVDIVIDNGQTKTGKTHPNKIEVWYNDKAYTLFPKSNDQQQIDIMLLSISERFTKSGQRKIKPASEAGESKDVSWWMGYRNPRLAQQVDLNGLLFWYGDLVSDWRLDAALLAYGAESAESPEDADIVVIRKVTNDAKSREKYCGVYTVMFKEKTFTLYEYWNNNQYATATRKLLRRLSELNKKHIPTGL